jgi:predicted Holliday junction resolvase-like endonuclease
MTNAEKQALRDKINEIIAEAQSKSDAVIEGKGEEALAMVPPDDGDPNDPPN